MLARAQSDNPTPYLTPATTPSNNYVTQIIAYGTTTTFTAVVDIAQPPQPNNPDVRGLTPAQIGGIVGGILGFILLLLVLLLCCRRPRRLSTNGWPDDPDRRQGLLYGRQRSTGGPDVAEIIGLNRGDFRDEKRRSIHKSETTTKRPVERLATNRRFAVEHRTLRPIGFARPKTRMNPDPQVIGSDSSPGYTRRTG